MPPQTLLPLPCECVKIGGGGWRERERDDQQLLKLTNNSDVLYRQTNRQTDGRHPCIYSTVLVQLSAYMYTITQGVVTPIGAILKAATGDTICDRLNLAVTP